MFNGDERVTISTDVSEPDFVEHLMESLENLGEIEIDKRGYIDIFPKTSLASAFATVRMSGKFNKTDDGYKVRIEYTIAPSQMCWIVGVLLFVFLCLIGGAVIFVPLLIDKPNVARAVEGGLRELKDSFRDRKRSG